MPTGRIEQSTGPFTLPTNNMFHVLWEKKVKCENSGNGHQPVASSSDTNINTESSCDADSGNSIGDLYGNSIP